jgi:hypothetical protein
LLISERACTSKGAGKNTTWFQIKEKYFFLENNLISFLQGKRLKFKKNPQIKIMFMEEGQPAGRYSFTA